MCDEHEGHANSDYTDSSFWLHFYNSQDTYTMLICDDILLLKHSGSSPGTPIPVRQRFLAYANYFQVNMRQRELDIRLFSALYDNKMLAVIACYKQ